MDAAQVKQILTKVDHTLLRVDSRWEEIQEVLDDAMRYETASACIPPSFVKEQKPTWMADFNLYGHRISKWLRYDGYQVL